MNVPLKYGMSVESPFLSKNSVPHPNTKLIFSPKNKHAWSEYSSSGFDEPLRKRIRMYMDQKQILSFMKLGAKDKVP